METNIQKALQKRIVAHKEGKLHGAELLYQAILKSQPTNLYANHNLGMSHYSFRRSRYETRNWCTL
jgi:hypothetical protein